MIILKTEKEVKKYVETAHSKNLSLGFTPTMGALHSGHLALIKQSLEENDLAICSIFVNPTQFNESSDLDKYPRTVEADCKGLESVGCQAVFLPTVDVIYPSGSDYEVSVNLNGLDQEMEGAKRPGHFEGVVQVVKRLLDIVTPDRLYMGQKDYQQFSIIGQMIKDLAMDVSLVVCEIQRAEDGLALSSRNVRLLPEHRNKASIIHRVLHQAKEWLEEQRSSVEISRMAMEYLEIPGFKPEYFDIIDGYSLRKIKDPASHKVIVACTAVWAGDVRLIDNMIIKGSLQSS